MRDWERDHAWLGEQDLGPQVLLTGERQPQQGDVGVTAGEPGGGVGPLTRSDSRPPSSRWRSRRRCSPESLRSPAGRARLAVMEVHRIVANLSSASFAQTREFYVEMFDLVVSVELDDWYLQLMPPGKPSLNVGFLKPDHEFFAGRAAPPGHYPVVLTIHVDDVDEAYARARRRGAEIVGELRDEEYGQRHFLVLDPNGVVLNVMSPI
jgi:predicted enzyme related to lactoylglutathione lyase